MKKILLTLGLIILSGCSNAPSPVNDTGPDVVYEDEHTAIIVYQNAYGIGFNDPAIQPPENQEVNWRMIFGKFFSDAFQLKLDYVCLGGDSPERIPLVSWHTKCETDTEDCGVTERQALICADQYVIDDFNETKGPMLYGPFDLKTHEFIDLTPKPGVVEESNYYSMSSQKDLPYYFVDPVDEEKAILIYLHGAGGGYEQGMSDDQFAGNFATLKDYTKTNGILYITPEISDFEEQGAAEILDLIHQLQLKHRETPIFISGASAGGATLFHVLDQLDERSLEINGLIFICPALSEDQVEALTAEAKDTPIWIEAGEIDSIAPVETVKKLNEKLLELGFETTLNVIPNGGHDTPVNEIKWAEVIQKFNK